MVQQLFGSRRLCIEIGGWVSFERQRTNSRHRHNYAELCLATQGSGRYVHGDEVHRIGPGSVFWAEPGVPHEISSFETGNLRLFFVRLTVQQLAPLEMPTRDALSAFCEDHAIVAGGHEALAPYPHLLSATSAPDELLKLFTLDMLAALTRDGAPKPSSKVFTGEVAAALDFIDRNLLAKLTVSDVAGHLGISERSLRRRFRDQLGTSVADEIHHRRMRHAAHCLLLGRSVGEVAHAVGIADPAQFSRGFRRALGVSPKRFQLSYMPGGIATQTRPE
jgi:AraC-like DNA-binding protein